MARQLIEAIRNGDTHLARNILLNDKYGCIDCQTAKRDGTALFWACAKGFLELVQLLIAKGANVNTRTNYNSTPLIAAADRNRYEVMRLLIQQGADVNAQTSKGDTACHLAAYRGHLEAVKVLLGAGTDIAITNTHFRTPYDDAIREGHFDVLPLLEGSEKIGAETKPATQSIAKSSSLYPHHHQQQQSHYHHHHHQTQHLHRPSSSLSIGKAPVVLPEPSVSRVEARRNSSDCLSNQSLSRESSYEDCGGQAIMNSVDWDDRLRSRDLPDFITAEILADAAAANIAMGVTTTPAPVTAVSPTFPAAATTTTTAMAINPVPNPASVYLSATGYPSSNNYINNDSKHFHLLHHPHHHHGASSHRVASASGVSPILAAGEDAHLTASGVLGSQGRLGGAGAGDGALQRLSFPDLMEDIDHYLSFPQHHHQHQHHDHYEHSGHVVNSGSSLASFDIVGANDLSSLAASSIPYGSYNDTGSNDLSLASDRPSSKKSLMSRMNIPA